MKKLILLLIIVMTQNIFSQNAQEKDSLLNIIKTSKIDSLVIEANATLFYKTVYENTKKSEVYYKAIFKIAKSKDNLFAYAKAYNLKGIASDVLGKLDSANYFYNKSVWFSKKCKAQSVEGSAYNNIGLINWDQGNYLEALKYFNKALQIFEIIKNKLLQANAISNIGLIYDDLNDLKKSEFYLLKSLEIRKSINDQYGLSVSFTNLGQLYGKQKKYNLSILNFKKALVIKRQLNDLMGVALTNNLLSNSLNKIKKYDESLSLLKESENICIENNAESSILENIYIAFIDSYLIKNDLESAKKYNYKLLEITHKTNDIARLSLFYEYGSDIAIKENNFKKAFFLSKKSDSIKKITQGLELRKSINLFETKYQTAKKEKQIIQQQADAKQQHLYLIGISVLALLTGLIGFLIYKQQKQKNQQQAQEHQLKNAIEKIENQNKLQEQRLSISRDLHDNIGSQLTFIISSVDNVKYGFDITNEKLDNKLTNISSFAKDTILELRDTIWAMNSNEISYEDLEVRINNFIEKAKLSKENISFSFAIDTDLKNQKLTSVEGMNVYRTIQEAINNALKYANSDIISVNIKKQENQTKITITDNGKGFNPETIQKGNGLNNMQKRIQEIGGKFDLNSSNDGTRIEILI